MNQLTALQKISHFNELIGNKKGSFSYLSQQFEMIREEFEELEKALTAFDRLGDEHGQVCGKDHEAALREIRDGIADVIVTTGGLAHRLGIDADADLELVYQSNMSKFIEGDSDDAFKAAEEVTLRLLIQVTVSETAPGIWALTSADDQVGSDCKQYPKGKLLKPATYHEPSFR